MANAASVSLICNIVPADHQIGRPVSGIFAPSAGGGCVSVPCHMVWPIAAAAKAYANYTSRHRVHAASGLILELPAIARTAGPATGAGTN